MDPEEALDACRAAGFAEGQWCHDVRAGRVQLETLSADTVMFVSEQETPLQMGDAANLLDAYQNGSIQPANEEHGEP